MNPRVERLERATKVDGDPIVWYAEHLDLRVSFTTEDPQLILWADPFGNMREIGIALVDESGTMRANKRRDRRYEWE